MTKQHGSVTRHINMHSNLRTTLYITTYTLRVLREHLACDGVQCACKLHCFCLDAFIHTHCTLGKKIGLDQCNEIQHTSPQFMYTTVGYADVAVVPAYLTHTAIWNIILTTASKVISSFITNLYTCKYCKTVLLTQFLHIYSRKHKLVNTACTIILFRGHLRELQL